LRKTFGFASHCTHYSRSTITFKGGTSLSKVYKVIERFSEDIDFVVSRDCLGFGGDDAPNVDGISGEERNRRLVKLGEACLKKVQDELLPSLNTSLDRILTRDGWSLELKEDEKHNQQIYFNYPKSRLTKEASYNPPYVRIELTARTDNHPARYAIGKKQRSCTNFIFKITLRKSQMNSRVITTT